MQPISIRVMVDGASRSLTALVRKGLDLLVYRDASPDPRSAHLLKTPQTASRLPKPRRYASLIMPRFFLTIVATAVNLPTTSLGPGAGVTASLPFETVSIPVIKIPDNDPRTSKLWSSDRWYYIHAPQAPGDSGLYSADAGVLTNFPVSRFFYIEDYTSASAHIYWLEPFPA